MQISELFIVFCILSLDHRTLLEDKVPGGQDCYAAASVPFSKAERVSSATQPDPTMT